MAVFQPLSSVPPSSRVCLRGGSPLAVPIRRYVPTTCSLMGVITPHALHHLSLGVMDTGSSISNSGLGFALASGGLIAVLAAALSLADPEKRRQQQTASVGGNEMDAVRNYFNTAGFDRWRRIYGETDDVNNVQLDIRQGHAETVEKVLAFLKKGGLEGVTVCDVGCGTGSLTVPMILEGAIVKASDISSAMVSEAEKKVAEALKSSNLSKPFKPPTFETNDLESLKGKYHTVACIDVLIHYPKDKAAGMIAHLASLAEKRLIISFAPETPFLAVLKRIGELFPGPSKATRAYLHTEADIEAALKAAGWIVKNKDMTSTKFYYSRLFEAVPQGNL
ncbi:hypothetical protein GOP47_0004658 [Adiantum capillus-veneris]|uniref:Magnesium-protoporphyrin IX methyltransferase C-terminal domain-containing protein n=1 Tax=Adiantum capillus-veneris TaxID=13818 RepID=A0A9D4ZQI8_ADICA|nr:hypothetical protein GOP47_0004658 [Adiantum capillus-veneris]